MKSSKFLIFFCVFMVVIFTLVIVWFNFKPKSYHLSYNYKSQNKNSTVIRYRRNGAGIFLMLK